jgi:hypothetical protein
MKLTYQASKSGNSSEDHGDKCQGDDNRRARHRVLEDMVDLGLLAISLSFNGRHGLFGVAINRQLEYRVVVGIRASEPANDNMRINWTGQGKELNRQVFLALDGMR